MKLKNKNEITTTPTIKNIINLLDIKPFALLPIFLKLKSLILILL